MSDTVDQAGLVIGFLVQHPHEIGVYLVHILPVGDILFQMMEHIDNLYIGSPVQRAFQRTDTGGNGRIGIRAGRTGHADGERRVVTSAMFGLQDKQQVERTGFQISEIFFQHMKEVLGDRKVFMRVADMQRTALLAMPVNVVSVGDDGRETRDQLDRLAHQVVARGIVGVRVERVHFEDATGQDVHDVLSLQVQDVHLRLLFERHIVADQLLEACQFFLVGQFAGQKQVGDFFKTETFFLDQPVCDVFHIVSAVKQFSGDRFQPAFRQTLVPHHVADLRQSYQHTCTVFITKPALHIIHREQFVVDLACFFGCIGQFINDIFFFHDSKF